MIVEAIRSDEYMGSHELEYGKRSRYACSRCGRSYEYVVHGAPGEFEALADPVPPHFDLLSEKIDADHEDGHHAKSYVSDGLRVWDPQTALPLELAWQNAGNWTN